MNLGHSAPNANALTTELHPLLNIFDEGCDQIKLFDMYLAHLLYADDLILMPMLEKGLNNSLEKLNISFEKWGLAHNTKKSKVIIFVRTAELKRLL